MNDYDYPGTGPCADYEFEIAEWLDGELPPERARIVSLHVASCVRCRAWGDAYAAIDRRLETSLPRPELRPGFAARVAASIDRLSTADASLRDAIEDDYAASLARLRRGWKIPAVLNALAAASVAFCTVALLRSVGVDVNVDVADPAMAPNTLLAASEAIAVVAGIGALVWARLRGAWFPSWR
jgi:anti-sigma factor RsiW